MAAIAARRKTTVRAGAGSLWVRWVVANALGEMLGLGGTALVGLALFPALGDGNGLLPALAVAAVAIAAGTAIEGATAIGAGIAWACGMLPSTLLSIGPDSGQGPATEPSAIMVYALAFAMGLVLGPVLGCAQWLVLRRHVTGASLWILANALAWAVGMVLVFAVVSAVIDRGGGPASLALAALGLAATGASVGGIHGLALVRLVGQRRMGLPR